jgi:hypothetical protein
VLLALTLWANPSKTQIIAAGLFCQAGLSLRQGLFILLEGLTGEGSFTAKTDKKGKKGRKDLDVSCPFLFFKCLPSSRAEPSMNSP